MPGASRRTRSTSGTCDADPDPRAGVVHVALRVPQRRLVLRLCSRRRVPGANENLVLSRTRIDRDPPVPPRPPAEVVEQLRLRPGRAAIKRDVDARDLP